MHMHNTHLVRVVGSTIYAIHMHNTHLVRVVGSTFCVLLILIIDHRSARSIPLLFLVHGEKESEGKLHSAYYKA